MLTLIENAEIYAPESLGRASLLLVGDKILKVGEIDRKAVESLGVELELIDAGGCLDNARLDRSASASLRRQRRGRIRDPNAGN